ncbi:FtsX-like permease family protein [Kitasatospora sp. NPDC096147]|uniref:FtsX-like permease family protein n=1 Tax=Kitasatospora sp. NPDC096147 TaxID=3364093 RepID=UPI00381263F5
MFGFVLRRLRGRLPLAAAVLLTVLTTTTVLTALAAFDRTVGEAGLRHALTGEPRGSLLLGTDRETPRAKDDAAVAGFAREVYGELPTTTLSVARSKSYGLPARPDGGRAADAQPDLTVLAALAPDRVEVLAGRLPQAPQAGGPVEVAAPSSTLDRLGLTAGALPATVTIVDRFTDVPMEVSVTGVYRAADRAAEYWRLDPLGGRETQVKGFTTYGPMLVDDAALSSGRVTQGGRSWLVTADFSTTTAERMADLGQRLPELRVEFLRGNGLQVDTGLAELVEELRSAALMARSTLLIGGLQLVALAVAALLLVVHLVTDRRAGENALLTARGASRARLAACTAIESVLLALPAALLAPVLAGPVLRLLGRQEALAGLPLDTTGWAQRWPVALVCAVVGVVLTSLPRPGARRVRSRRQAVVSTAARSGADLALLALAALAYRQLTRQSGGLSTAADGTQGIDPVLVAAPTVALCAGTLLVLRLLPFAARWGARTAARGRALGPALAGWQLARRPGRANGPVLLLVLAMATGVLALGQHTAWDRSQRDQADFTTAGGLRISGSTTNALGQGGQYGALPGGERLIPAALVDQSLPGDRTGRLLMLDTTGSVARLPVRPDLFAGRPIGDVLGPLTPGALGGLPLPGRPARIDLGIELRPGVPAEDAFPVAYQSPTLWLMLRDRYGLVHRAVVPPLGEGGRRTVSVDLTALAGPPVGSVAAPLTLAAVVVNYSKDTGQPGAELTVHRLAVADTAGGPATPVPLPSPGAWSVVQDAQPGMFSKTPKTWLKLLPAPEGGQRLSYESPRTGGMTSATLIPAGPRIDGRPDDGPLPAVATRDYLAAIGAKTGDTVQVLVGGSKLPVRITSEVPVLPVAGATAIALDLPALSGRLAVRGLLTSTVPEWWLPAAGPDDRTPATAAAALRSQPGFQQLELNGERATKLLHDPVSAAPQGALTALAVVAALLAAIGFAAAASAAATERAGESAVLLALGTPRRLLTRAVTAEQAVLITLGTTTGLALGTVLVHLTVPLLVLTPTARPPLPAVLIALPLWPTLALTAATAGLPLLTAVLGTARRNGPAAALRRPEES